MLKNLRSNKFELKGRFLFDMNKYGCPYREPHWHDGGDVYLCRCQGKNYDCVESYERYYNPSTCKHKKRKANFLMEETECQQLEDRIDNMTLEIEYEEKEILYNQKCVERAKEIRRDLIKTLDEVIRSGICNRDC